MSNYNEYTQNEAMLSSLYGESSATERATSMRDVKSEQNYAVEAFQVYIKSRKELISNYFTYLFFGLLVNCCCCITACCNRSGVIRRSARRYQKFKLALERLTLEQDIQYILEMNRINRLLHKDIFKKRQRRAINYSHKFVISDRQLEKESLKKERAT